MTLKEYRLHYSDATHRAIAKGLKKGGGCSIKSTDNIEMHLLTCTYSNCAFSPVSPLFYGIISWRGVKHHTHYPCDGPSNAPTLGLPVPRGNLKQHEVVGAAIYRGHFIILSLVKIVSTKTLEVKWVCFSCMGKIK